MKHEDFEKVIESLPSYQRLAFIHGERLFIRDEDCYRITSIQMAYEIYLRLKDRSELLSIEIDTTAIGDGEPKQIRPIICSRGQQIWCDRDEHPDCFERLKISEDEDHLTDGQVWIAIGIIILLILIISFSAFPSP